MGDVYDSRIVICTQTAQPVNTQATGTVLFGKRVNQHTGGITDCSASFSSMLDLILRKNSLSVVLKNSSSASGISLASILCQDGELNTSSM